MPKSTLISLQQKIKQTQSIIMTQQMQQAIHLLQVPIMELSAILIEHLEQNPIIESDTQNDDIDDIDESEQTEETDPELLEKSLFIRDGDFEILRRIEEDFHPTFEESVLGNHSEAKEYQSYIEQSIRSQPTLFEHLMKQANEAFEQKAEQMMAETIIGNFNENGYLDVPLQEIAALNNFPLEKLDEILQKIQTFDPYGVGASTLQESLLSQLRLLNKEDSLAARIVKEHYDDLLHNRIPIIQKNIGCSSKEIAYAVSHDLLRLDLHPGIAFSRDPVQIVVPDVTLQQDGDALRILVNHDFLPPLRVSARYRTMLEDPDVPCETKDFIRKKILSFKWLCRNIHQRGTTLERITASLTKRQRAFFLEPEGVLTPLTMKEIADELELNESTIARAVANKYLDSPRGLHPLRFFFSNAYINENGKEISATTVRNILKSMIHKEDKTHPLSDEALSLRLRDHGIACARRTISKYRAELNLGNALQRKKF